MIADWIPGSDLGLHMLVHEAEAQQTPDRRLRDLGDGWLLHDRSDAEPFWTRLIAPRWPDDPAAFDRRLDDVVTLFATIDRLPHVRPAPLATEPPDLPDRLLRYGFTQVAADRRMVLVDADPCLDLAQSWDGARRAARWPAELSVARYGLAVGSGPDRHRWAADASLVLAEAFAVDPLRRSLLEGDALACVGRPGCTILVLRAGDEPVAVARLARSGDGGYLSSIGVRPASRRHGYGGLVTALAVAEAVAAGCRLVHLAVEVENAAARALYEGLGFEAVGEPAPDLLLR